MTVVLIIALTAVSAVLVIFAIHQPPVADSGVVPSAPPVAGSPSTPAPSPNSSPSPGADSAPTDPPPAPYYLDSSQSPELFRATRGQCGSVSPVLDVSQDGGATWVGATFGTLEVGQILSVDVVDADQTDIVAALLPDCRISLISTFTGGQYWESYPERLAEGTFVDPLDSSKIDVGGAAVATPCTAVTQVVQRLVNIAVNCMEGVFHATVDDGVVGVWEPVIDEQAATIAYDYGSGGLVAVVSDDADCDGLGLRKYGVGPQRAVVEASDCLPEVASKPIGITSEGSAVKAWSQEGFFVSADGGAVWSQVN
ncbi:hypothetical protein NVV95_04080 [Herbiconiux sp. CPCC 205716]|uniref:Uncharacterized protein n=1 Tax=Herbiconiux gentiana TaxID=2970912 RepID=A0ABT2GBZ8_9MICO|nr:hypothetical protein [Herbiconiux gentiana]MCS5713728.1 hypothetical protein [Herbiconiux gentiana]